MAATHRTPRGNPPATAAGTPFCRRLPRFFGPSSGRSDRNNPADHRTLARSILAVVLKKPVLLRIQPRGNFVFDGFAERFVGLRIVGRSVMLAEGAAVGADFELLFSADDVSALRAVEKHRVDRAHAMAFRFGCW